MCRHRLAEVDERACQLLVDDLEGEGRVENGCVDVAGQQVRYEPAAAERNARELYLVLGNRPQRQDVGAGARGGDSDLLSCEICRLGDG
jgi:hypothetical protein